MKEFIFIIFNFMFLINHITVVLCTHYYATALCTPYKYNSDIQYNMMQFFFYPQLKSFSYVNCFCVVDFNTHILSFILDLIVKDNFFGFPNNLK